jgi:hypothetical protein
MNGERFENWAAGWIKSISSDIYSIEFDPSEIMRRNERYGSYLATLSTLIGIYRVRNRELRDAFYRDNPRPANGEKVKEFEERRDSATAMPRYMLETLERLHSDIEKRISISQSNLGIHRAEIRSNLD